MLHNTLSALLVSVASRYAELSPADVGIGIGGGRLVIDNVQLRADTFNAPGIPFHVHEGRAGRLRVNVPWSALSSAPVEVYLENVHLIAGPKQIPAYKSAPQKPASSDINQSKDKWHQTMVGRLLFNVSAEMYGLKIEYRDDKCVGIVSVASLRAFSAGPDWEMRFVSLLSDIDPNQPDATAVTMRKLVRLKGVHWVMIPRTKLAENELESSTASQRNLDLDSYESKSPILDGVNITVKILLYTGATFIGNQVTPGLHAEMDVDIEEPNINLTARQFKWIDHILKQGFGINHGDVPHLNSSSQTVQQNVQETKRRPRSVPPTDIPNEEVTNVADPNHVQPPLSNYMSTSDNSYDSHISKEGQNLKQQPLSNSHNTGLTNDFEAQGAEYVDSHFYENDEYEETSSENNEEHYLDRTSEEYDNFLSQDQDKGVGGGGLRSFWQAIVGENGDETVDDAAIALGLSPENEGIEEEEEDGHGEEEDEADKQYARSAVNAAANAGGLTFQLRIKTPDLPAWDEVARLREQVIEERVKRSSLEGIEEILDEAKIRVFNSEQTTNRLREKNEALVKELEDLERMTSQAGRNKDAMIRQMEAALSHAERNLQAMYQSQFERHSIRSNGNATTESIVEEQTGRRMEVENIEAGALSEGTASQESCNVSPREEIQVGEEEASNVHIEMDAISPIEASERFYDEEQLRSTVELNSLSLERASSSERSTISDGEVSTEPEVEKEVPLVHNNVLGSNMKYDRRESWNRFQGDMASEGLTLI